VKAGMKKKKTYPAYHLCPIRDKTKTFDETLARITTHVESAKAITYKKKKQVYENLSR
jgi:hypothetical protein